MTAQSPDRLDSQHHDFIHAPPMGYACTIRDVPGTWRVYAAIRGTPSEENHGWGAGAAYTCEPEKAEAISSSNWKGYVRLYQLTAAGQLVLVGFKYDRHPERQHLVHETIEGDFFLVLKQSFFASRLYVPFRDGVLVADRTEWICELGRLAGFSEDQIGYRRFDLGAQWMPRWLAFRLE